MVEKGIKNKYTDTGHHRFADVSEEITGHIGALFDYNECPGTGKNTAH